MSNINELLLTKEKREREKKRDGKDMKATSKCPFRILTFFQEEKEEGEMPQKLFFP